jgi:hypothetical protein
MGKKNAPVQRGVKNLLSGISLLMVSEGLDTGFSDLGLLVGFQRYRMLAFLGLDCFGFFGFGFLSLLIQRCKKQGPERNFFDRRAFLPDEWKICPTKG